MQKLISLMRSHLFIFIFISIALGERIKKMWYIHIAEYYSAMKKNEIRPLAETWIDAEMIIRSEVSQRKTNIWHHLYMQSHGLYSPWNFPGRNTGVGSHSLLQGIFQTQGSSLCPCSVHLICTTTYFVNSSIFLESRSSFPISLTSLLYIPGLPLILAMA